MEDSNPPARASRSPESTQDGIEAALRAMPAAITPRYVTSAVNSPVALYSGKMTLRPEQSGASVEGSLFLRWLPRPHVSFELTDRGLIPRLSEDWLRIEGLGSSCRVATLSTSIPAGRFLGRLLDDPPLSGNQVEKVTFHLANFHSYLGDAIHHEGWGASRGRLVLRHHQWRITLDQVVGDDTLRKTLEAEGGFAITNVGCIERTDGRAFSKHKAGDLLSALHYFFSFCRGIWCGPTLAVGELRGATSWLRWVPLRLTRWRNRRSWWPQREWQQAAKISRAFSGFMTLWNRSLWRDPLTNCIHWYVEANSDAGGIEGGLILVQTALELLSWLVAVEDPRTRRFAEKHFDKWAADERIRHLLTILRIPAAVPTADLPELTTALPKIARQDGLGALVTIRNAVVHPRRAKRTALSRIGIAARIDALSLSLWFLEMSLLRRFGYRGIYYSRLRSGYSDEIRAVMP
jgi:hypothetical protein